MGVSFRASATNALACSVLLIASAAHRAPAQSCEGWCGLPDANGCACDPACCVLVDCCDDVLTACGIDCAILQACTGDTNQDDVTDSNDLNMLLADFGCVKAECQGDINQDGETNAEDINALLADFPCNFVAAPVGACCLPGECQVTFETACALYGGIFMGGATSCDDVLCIAPPDGACSLPNETWLCAQMTPQQCELQGGVFCGFGSLCQAPEPPFPAPAGLRIFGVGNMFGGWHPEDNNPYGLPSWWYTTDEDPIEMHQAAVDKLVAEFIDPMLAMGFDGVYFRPIAGVYKEPDAEVGYLPPFASAGLLPAAKLAILQTTLATIARANPDFELTVYNSFRLTTEPTYIVSDADPLPDLSDPAHLAALTAEIDAWSKASCGINWDSAGPDWEEYLPVYDLCQSMGVPSLAEPLPPLTHQSDAANLVREKFGGIMRSFWLEHPWFATSLGYNAFTSPPGVNTLYLELGENESIDEYQQRTANYLRRGYNVAIYAWENVDVCAIRALAGLDCEGNPISSCQGFCDAQAPAGCYCNASCCEFQDCCEDAGDVCGVECISVELTQD